MAEQGGPVAVGGVGGSGTRVVAALLREAGVYLGADLNDSLDNLWFRLLFRRAQWYRDQVAGGAGPDGRSPAERLAYWIAANTRAVQLGRRLLGDRFLLAAIPKPPPSIGRYRQAPLDVF